MIFALTTSLTRTGFRNGVREAFGPAAAVMWALPGQIILVEMVAAKAGLIAIALVTYRLLKRNLLAGMGAGVGFFIAAAYLRALVP